MPQVQAQVARRGPIAFEAGPIADVTQESFGLVLHTVRWRGDVETVIDQINALGHGLTLGLQTRIDSRALRLATRARMGNGYVNLNIIGAEVSVRPFGGEGLSGTGPEGRWGPVLAGLLCRAGVDDQYGRGRGQRRVAGRCALSATHAELDPRAAPMKAPTRAH